MSLSLTVSGEPVLLTRFSGDAEIVMPPLKLLCNPVNEPEPLKPALSSDPVHPLPTPLKNAHPRMGLQFQPATTCARCCCKSTGEPGQHIKVKQPSGQSDTTQASLLIHLPSGLRSSALIGTSHRDRRMVWLNVSEVSLSDEASCVRVHIKVSWRAIFGSVLGPCGVHITTGRRDFTVQRRQAQTEPPPWSERRSRARNARHINALTAFPMPILTEIDNCRAAVDTTTGVAGPGHPGHSKTRIGVPHARPPTARRSSLTAGASSAR